MDGWEHVLCLTMGQTWEEPLLRDLSVYSGRHCEVHRQEECKAANHKIKQLLGLIIILV